MELFGGGAQASVACSGEGLSLTQHAEPLTNSLILEGTKQRSGFVLSLTKYNGIGDWGLSSRARYQAWYRPPLLYHMRFSASLCTTSHIPWFYHQSPRCMSSVV